MWRLQPDGLLGQTWRAEAELRGASEEEAEKFRERGNELRGCRHAHDRFCTRPQPQEPRAGRVVVQD